MPAVRRKAGANFTDGQIPDKRQATENAFWEPTPDRMAAFVNNCNVNKTARLIIPVTAVNAVAEHITSIIAETNCSILMPPSRTAERNVFITSNFEINDAQASAVEDVADCVCKIAEFAAFAHKSFNHRLGEGQCESRIVVSSEVCGLLCSKGAEQLKNMRRATKAAIKLNRPKAPESNDRIIEVCGNPDRVKEAIAAILVAVREIDFKDQSVVRKFYNANDATEGDYGGFVPYTTDIVKEPSLEETSSNEPVTTDVQIRVLLPHEVSSRVIGNGGKTISRLRSTHDCILKVHNSNTKESSLDIISSRNADNLTAAVNCLTEIVTFCNEGLRTCALEAGYNHFGEDPCHKNTEIRLLANRATVGRVIGTKGLTMKQLQRDHSVFMRIYETCCPGSSDRVVQVAGEIEGIMGAVRNIARMLTEEKPKESKSGIYFNGDTDPGFNGSCLHYGGYNVDYKSGFGVTNYNSRKNFNTSWSGGSSDKSSKNNTNGANVMSTTTLSNNAMMANMGGMTMFGAQPTQPGFNPMQNQMASMRAMGMGGPSAMSGPFYGGLSMGQMPGSQTTAVGFAGQNQAPVQKPVASGSKASGQIGTAAIAKNMGMDEATYKMFKKQLMQEILKDM